MRFFRTLSLIPLVSHTLFRSHHLPFSLSYSLSSISIYLSVRHEPDRVKNESLRFYSIKTHKRFFWTNCNAVVPSVLFWPPDIKISVIFYANDDGPFLFAFTAHHIWITDALFISKYAIHFQYLHLIFPNTINHFIYYAYDNMLSQILPIFCNFLIWCIWFLDFIIKAMRCNFMNRFIYFVIYMEISASKRQHTWVKRFKFSINVEVRNVLKSQKRRKYVFLTNPIQFNDIRDMKMKISYSNRSNWIKYSLNTVQISFAMLKIL